MKNNPFRLFGVHLTTLSTEAVFTKTISWLRREDGCRLIFTPNPEILLKARKNSEYKNILNNADLLLPDGVGIVWASKALGGAVKKRLTGVDVAEYIIDYASRHSLKVCIVLAEKGLTNIDRARKFFEKYYPKLEINFISANRHYLKSGHIISDINAYKPEILLVTFGAPEQEYWLFKHKHQLKGVRVAMGIGGALDMIVGTVKRAPAVVRNNHLEWAWRLVKSPKRIIRIVNAVLIFPTHVLKDALISRVKYRKNVLAFIFRNKESILIIHKTYYDGHTGRCWAFPQGGVDDGETEEEALLREVKEEVGLHKQIKIVGMSLFKHRYKFSQFHRNVYGYKYAGQYQRAYYIKLVGEEKVHLEDDGGVHIDSYRFVTQEELLKLIKPPRRENALKLLNEFNQKRIYDRKTS